MFGTEEFGIQMFGELFSLDCLFWICFKEKEMNFCFVLVIIKEICLF